MMKMRLFVGVSLLFLFSLNLVNGQSGADTLERAKHLRDQGKLKAAMRLLEPYHAVHPTDLNPAWVYAQTSYWAKQYRLSRRLYELTIWYHPENLYLQLDYANMLVQTGKVDMAMPYLTNYLRYFPDDSAARLILARIEFWRGFFKQASQTLSDVLSAEPENSEARSLQLQVTLARSPWIGIASSFSFDDQPLRSISPGVESEIWLHRLSTLHLRVHTPIFSEGKGYPQAIWVEAGNRAAIWKGYWHIDVTGGLIRFPYRSTLSWTGSLSVEKRSFRHLITSLRLERKPYFSTLASVDTVVLENRLAATIGWDDNNSWNGQVSLQLDHFLADRNTVHAFSAWIFAPPVKVSVMDFRIGYGFSYASANQNRFSPDQSLAEIVATYNPSVGIEGIYTPYFTPDDQRIHSALLNIGIHPARWVDLGAGGNLGFYATAMIPYLYLDSAGNGSGKLIVKKGYSNESYLPFTVSGFALFGLSKTIGLRVEYNLSSTYYYLRHYAGLHLKIHLWNGKRGN